MSPSKMRKTQAYLDGACEADGMRSTRHIHVSYDGRNAYNLGFAERTAEIKTAAEPIDKRVESVARAIYLALYAEQGGRWECVETRDVWFDAARRALKGI